MAKDTAIGSDGVVDHNQDRYPDFTKVLRRIIQEADLPDGPVEFLEIRTTAGGECTYRVWAPRADESDGGYLGPQ